VPPGVNSGASGGLIFYLDSLPRFGHGTGIGAAASRAMGLALFFSLDRVP